MEVVYRCCAGLDVHKETVAACALWVDAAGKSRKEVRTFGTTTRELLALSDWLGAKAVTHVAMESTGVFWKPVFNILEARFEVLLFNPRDIKQVPGRKTDVKDSEWIAQLLQHGLLRASFVPDRPQRELRDLTRHRAQLVAEIGTDMAQFPTDRHLSSWPGLCPGNHESAGKRKSGKTPKANRWLRRCLSQGAWAARHTKNTYLSSQFRRLAGRRGKKRAIIALAHTMLVIAYHVLKERTPYRELGADHFDRLQPDRLKRSLIRRLQSLGYSVNLEPTASAA